MGHEGDIQGCQSHVLMADKHVSIGATGIISILVGTAMLSAGLWELTPRLHPRIPLIVVGGRFGFLLGTVGDVIPITRVPAGLAVIIGGIGLFRRTSWARPVLECIAWCFLIIYLAHGAWFAYMWNTFDPAGITTQAAVFAALSFANMGFWVVVCSLTIVLLRNVHVRKALSCEQRVACPLKTGPVRSAGKPDS